MTSLTSLSLHNPFNAPVYYAETLASTMDESRKLALRGEAHGTVIAAGFQTAGRGRTTGRVWQGERGKNLFFTILLRYGDFAAIPCALTLRSGLALSLAVEDFAPALTGSVRVKWPNDLMIGSKKAAGILIEGDGETVYAGIGVNVGQREFPDHLQQKATSIALAQQAPSPDSPGAPDPRFKLLERILARLFEELEDPAGDREDWRDRLTARLYRINQPVRFLPGAADSGRSVKGLLKGIGPGGELLIIPEGETDPRPYITGELELY